MKEFVQEPEIQVEVEGIESPRGKRKLREWWQDESGIGVVEVILILVILIGLVIIFREQITEIVEEIFESITSGVEEVTK